MKNTIPTLTLSVLGDFQLFRESEIVEGINTARMRALLTYLALHRDAETTRQRIAFLFWPDSEESQARTNLRQLLHHLRQAFPDIEICLNIDSRRISWRADVPLHIDVAEFAKYVSEAEGAAANGEMSCELKALEQAARLYRADLLPECYEEWIEPERDRLRQLFFRVLRRLTQLLEQQGKYQKALDYAERLLTLDEFDESTYRLLMRLHALNRNRPGALRIYHRCLKVLRDELGLEPAAETQEAYERLTQQDAKPKSTVPMETEIPLVGREQERRVLLEAWKKVTLGNTRVFLLGGEAGIGKTRLAEELIYYVRQQGFTTATAYCYAAGGRLTYGPVSEWLRTEAIYQVVLSLEPVWQAEVARLLPELLTDSPDLSPPAPLTEIWQRKRLFESLARAVMASEQPLLLFIDDIQWCDPETVEWLQYLLRFESSAKALIMATVRTEDVAGNGPLLSFLLELRRSSIFSEIELGAIDASQTALLASHVAGKNLDDEAATALYASTEGNPLFVVETTRALMDDWNTGADGDTKIPEDIPLPRKVQAVIQSRLSQISSHAKKLLELSAIIGREFTFDILSKSCEENEETIIQSLDELWQHRLIREQGRMAYDFSHDKIREVTAAGISRTRSCLLHRRVAESLEKMYSRQLDPVSGQLAAHWENAGVPLRAIQYCEQAGRVAQQIYANDEAVKHLQHALLLVQENLEGPERERRELNILRLLSPCLVQGRGYGASEVQVVGARVWKLSQQLDERAGSPLLRMLAISSLVGGEIMKAERFGSQLLEQAQNENDAVAEVEAHYVLGVTYHWQGNFVKAREHLEKAIGLYDPRNHHTHITAYAQDPAVICRIRLSLVLWHLGYPFQAQSLGLEALELARELQHPFSRAYALHWFAWLQNLRADPDATLSHAEISIAFSEEYQFPYFATQSGILYGWACFTMGEVEDGIQRMREGLSRFRATGSEIGCAYYRALIAGALAANGSFAQSLPLLEEVLKSMAHSGECWSMASVLEIKGAVLLAEPGQNHSHAEQAFQEAITGARKQNAKMDALIAAANLKQLWLRTGKKKDAREMFEDVYGWATRGQDSQEMNALTTLVESWTERYKS
ncbi:MAG: AAA family ATPase [bacterium]